MRNQLRIERYKAKRFVIMYFAAAVLAAAGFFCGLLKLPENYNTEKVFSISICDTSFLFIVSLVAAWFVGNDFLNRTIHNEIKAGYNRFSVFIVRTITSVIMAELLHLTYVFTTVLGFAVKYRFDGSIFSTTNFVWLLVVMLQIWFHPQREIDTGTFSPGAGKGMRRKGDEPGRIFYPPE